ncbi:DoxX family protein [Patescibacteria group bacterium]|nr:DoxX family protein [Patescibacteria group bacterium]MBU1500849.1 DoxX family protein [Patescibacteria group bacterium]MBU2080904.1 DoxX family protein [Patescibacteria group bacterium]MBU2124009.1 DoxX family protein [Patescibacteria group bacterium]MBU2194700.1 DoxX family protein [Patescibacteria group bacterium]
MRTFLHGSYPAHLQDFAPLVLRVVVGVIFALHGYQKLEMGVPGVTGFLAGLGFPMPAVFAVLLIAAELVGGILLILGLFTYWNTRILGIVAVVALLTVHISKGFFVSAGGYEFILLILAATISLMITGPGKWSLDKMMQK